MWQRQKTGQIFKTWLFHPEWIRIVCPPQKINSRFTSITSIPWGTCILLTSKEFKGYGGKSSYNILQPEQPKRNEENDEPCQSYGARNEYQWVRISAYLWHMTFICSFPWFKNPWELDFSDAAYLIRNIIIGPAALWLTRHMDARGWYWKWETSAT